MLELERREERLRTVVTNAPVLLVALDRHGMVTLAEGQGLAALGLQPAQMVGRSAFDLFPEASQTRDHVRRALAGEVVTALDRLGTLDFETHWLPLRDHSGQL